MKSKSPLRDGKEKEYIVGMDFGINGVDGKVGILAERNPDGSLTIIGEKFEPMSSAKECKPMPPVSSFKLKGKIVSVQDSKPTSYPKYNPKVSAKESWAIDFKKVFPPQKYEDRSEGYYLKADYSVIEDFISTLLQKEKEALVERIKEILIESSDTMDENGELYPVSAVFQELDSLTK